LSRIFKSSQVKIDNEKFEFKSTDFLDISEKKEEANNIQQKYDELEKLTAKKLADAQSEADRIISDAYVKAKEIMERAKTDGFEQGKLEGYNEGKLYGDQIVEEALNIKNEVLSFKSNFIKDIESDVIELVIKTVEKILNTKIEEEDTIINIIKFGLDRCAFTEGIILRVSPADYELVNSFKNRILAVSENISDIDIKQDTSLEKGSCIIDTLSGSVDPSIRAKFTKIKEIFNELIKSE